MFRSCYVNRPEPVKLDCAVAGPSRTKQSFAAECDINNIMKRFHQTGLVSHVNQFQGSYEDVSRGLDYRESLDVLERGKQAFASLPSKLRAKFHNDPGEFLEFVSNPANRDAMGELGLLKAKPVVAPVVTEAPAAAGAVVAPAAVGA